MFSQCWPICRVRCLCELDFQNQTLLQFNGGLYLLFGNMFNYSVQAMHCSIIKDGWYRSKCRCIENSIVVTMTRKCFACISTKIGTMLCVLPVQTQVSIFASLKILDHSCLFCIPVTDSRCLLFHNVGLHNLFIRAGKENSKAFVALARVAGGS